MITNRGKDIIARFLAGQTISTFSHLAIGTGSRPATDNVEPTSTLTRTCLDFEALRVPITSASVVSEAGKTNLVFSATLPSQSRYEFSEVGIFSAEDNSLLTTAKDSLIFVFSQSEGWVSGQDSSQIVKTTLPSGTDITTTDNLSFIPAADPVLLTPKRYLQRSRIGEDCLLIKGGFSSYTPGTPGVALGSTGHIAISGVSIDLTNARPDDEIKFAFSVLTKNYLDLDNIVTRHPSTGIDFRVDFVHGSEFAAWEQTIPYAGLSTIIPANTEISTNGYFVASKAMKDLTYTTNFDWSAVNSVRVYAKVSDTTPSNFFISPDALRFESRNDNNPTYGLVAYSPVSNIDGATQVKSYGLESQIEYKLPLEVS